MRHESSFHFERSVTMVTFPRSLLIVSRQMRFHVPLCNPAKKNYLSNFLSHTFSFLEDNSLLFTNFALHHIFFLFIVRQMTKEMKIQTHFISQHFPTLVTLYLTIFMDCVTMLAEGSFCRETFSAVVTFAKVKVRYPMGVIVLCGSRHVFFRKSVATNLTRE